ncbi:MAG: M67 family metallopeptidase [Cyclobacteriaceae bacterium]|nr:M67 family metallopeptidase [Cyclobacteriaceae bacterium]
MKPIVIPSKLLDQMEKHARADYPNECCGFFFGNEQTGSRQILAIRTVENSKKGDKKRRFEISAKEYMMAERYGQERQLALLGVYHSHPNHPAIPSKHDLKQAVPYFSYIIMSVNRHQVKKITSWQLIGDQFIEEEIIIENQIETLN